MRSEPDGRPLKDVLRDAIARGQELKRRHLEEMAVADQVVLCSPGCSLARAHTQHAHTYGDMLRMEGGLRYEMELALRRRELDGDGAVDVDSLLRRAYVGDVHRQGLRAIDHARPTLQVAARWWRQPRQQVASEWRPVGGEAPVRLRLQWPFLLQLGPTGTGKTQAAVWALAQWAKAQRWNNSPGGVAEATPIVYTRAGHLESLPLYDGHLPGRLSGWVSEACACRVLLLDELAADVLSGPVVKALQDVMDTRYRERRITLLTSNASGKEIEQRMDGDVEPDQAGRLWRRILEAGVVAMHEKKKMRLLIGGREVHEEARHAER